MCIFTCMCLHLKILKTNVMIHHVEVLTEINKYTYDNLASILSFISHTN